jgi:hypothetical protein
MQPKIRTAQIARNIKRQHMPLKSQPQLPHESRSIGTTLLRKFAVHRETVQVKGSLSGPPTLRSRRAHRQEDIIRNLIILVKWSEMLPTIMEGVRSNITKRTIATSRAQGHADYDLGVGEADSQRILLGGWSRSGGGRHRRRGALTVSPFLVFLQPLDPKGRSFQLNSNSCAFTARRVNWNWPVRHRLVTALAPRGGRRRGYGRPHIGLDKFFFYSAGGSYVCLSSTHITIYRETLGW